VPPRSTSPLGKSGDSAPLCSGTAPEDRGRTHQDLYAIKRKDKKWINQIDNVRTSLSDEFYPDNLHTLEVLREKIEEILVMHL
jgi:hypothetical protein